MIPRKASDNLPYVVWFIIYFLVFWLITGLHWIGLIILLIVYTISIIFAFSPAAEILWRTINGVRPLRIRQEKLRLLPLFKEVYTEAVNVVPSLSRGIKLYIKEDMNINASSFGRKTLVLTRGSLELLDDECLKGLLIHELGHFVHYDTVAVLIASIGNFFMITLMKYLTDLKKVIDEKKKDSIIMGCVKFLYDCIFYIFRSIQFLCDSVLMHISRKNEYLADLFAYHCGFGAEMTAVLIEIYNSIISKPQSIKELIKSDHPPITKRIEHLEKMLYSD